MNIFVLDENPEMAAIYHNNCHTSKMVLETAQILCSALIISGHSGKGLYKLTHKSHPCVLWTARSKSNFEWLVKLGRELHKEKVWRTGAGHKSLSMIEKANTCSHIITSGNRTPFEKCVEDDCLMEDPIESYRTYYMKHKIFNKRGDRMDNRGKRGCPEWWNVIPSK